VQGKFLEDSQYLLPEIDGAIHFDLWAANRLLLERGVQNIEVAGLCTACHLEDCILTGRKGNTGRFGVLIALMA
jgi:copper oxidase (laccase) domain-containing protein